VQKEQLTLLVEGLQTKLETEQKDKQAQMDAAIELIGQLKEKVDLSQAKPYSEQEKCVSFEDFQELDAYTSALSEEYQQLQVYCR